MPYLKDDDKEMFYSSLRHVPVPVVGGELNFLFTHFVNQFLLKRALAPDRNGVNRYEDYNEAIGALECAKLELYRRLIAPYEDVKIEENGDVY